MKTMYNKTWGVSPLTHQYNQKNKISENPHLQLLDLGAQLLSLRPENNNNNNNNNENENENDGDSQMDDSNEDDVYTQAILSFLSNTDNISKPQTDLVLKFFNTARAEQQRLEIKQQQQIQKEAQAQQQKEQREGGATMLLSVLPWLTMDQALTVMEMKNDIIEQATDYCMNTDPADLFMAVNDWKVSHPKASDSNNHNKGNNNLDVQMTNQRSTIDMRVMNRSQTTGLANSVMFQCLSIADDGQITLQAVLDRNCIPLAPSTAKLLHLSVSDLMSCEGVAIESAEQVQIAQKERVLSIVFQVVKDAQNDMSQYAQYQMLNESAPNISSWRNQVRGHQETEFVPIQFQPRCRDLEYELEFEDKSPPNNSCLKSVKHRTDGPVLFKGVYDDGAGLGLIGIEHHNPIDIYTQVIDDVTHNVLCIIFENDLRDNVVIDVKNISFTEQTLKDVIADSEKDFTKKDAAGNKISYRIIVKDKKIIGVLTKFGNEIKEMAFIEHAWLSEGELVRIPSRNMLGIVKCIPTGLIVTNDPNINIEKKTVKYPKNVNSRIVRKHCADLDGFIDVDVVREGDEWRDSDNPLCQSFAVTDLKQRTDEDIAMFISYKQQNQSNMTDLIKSLMESVENDFEAIKANKTKKKDDDNEQKDDATLSAKELLDRATNNVKKLQESVSAFKKRKSVLNDDETNFIKSVNDSINKYNREMRALRFEIKMT